ncbi:HAD hydrolase-like protein [Nitrincola sp. A-D6]|uniref:HAD hydrolase-like protein n=1 Tax=Nitrincola sp. A-D6 TaxID=1545442 RepID=UPI0013630F57|nr:HAD family hydrolase [Nitrincola sp. A-D6]
MNLVLFDIDGTLVESYDFDTECFQAAVEDVLGVTVGPDWSRYKHVTDSGILAEVIDELDLKSDADRITTEVKEQFVSRVADYIACHDVAPISGAHEFLSQLIARENVTVAFATGGWSESARMKLVAAGINFSSIPLVSSSDHYSRTEIMRLAEKTAGIKHLDSITYFATALGIKRHLKHWDIILFQSEIAFPALNLFRIILKLMQPLNTLAYNQAKHGDSFSVAASPSLQSCACWRR